MNICTDDLEMFGLDDLRDIENWKEQEKDNEKEQEES